MAELKNSFMYEFEGELSYVNKKTGNGEPQKAVFITVKAPTNKDINEVMIIEQEYQKAELGVASILSKVIGQETLSKFVENNESYEKPSESSAKEDINRDSILKQLLSGNADMIKCFGALKTILLKGSHTSPMAVIDDAEKLTNGIYEDISVPDIKNILAEYILNFIVTSQAV